MKSPFPIPAIGYFPPELQGDLEGQALASAIDRALGGIQGDVVNMRDLFVPEACPPQLLDELAATVKADTNLSDPTSMKRRKIATAIKGHKSRGLWAPSVKPFIDSIVVPWGSTGCKQYTSIASSSAWLIKGNTVNDIPNNMGVLGDDGINDWGLTLIGAGNEVEISGNIYIDLGISTLSASQINMLVASLVNDFIPPYFRVTLGYVQGGNFNFYVQIG